MTPSPFSNRTESAPDRVDVIIAGAGISGTLAASALARDGYSVCLIDRYQTYPVDFKAEHLDGPQIGQLLRLGFLAELTNGLYRGETVTLARNGKIVGSAMTENYGLTYEDLVNRARSNLPPTVHTVLGRIDSLRTSAAAQSVRLSDGRSVSGRLLILATGPGYALQRLAGIRRKMLRDRHSVTFGFDIAPVDAAGFAHSFVVYQREKIEDRVDYLAAFTMGAAMRVNLFTYRDIRDSWTAAFLDNPDAALSRSLPGLGNVIGPYRTAGPAVARPVDLYTSENHCQDGIVLIGDAFQSTCPATGMGIVKVLTDIEQLARVHIPHWFATPGMSAGKIAQYYDDPVKQACDAKALHDSEYRRSLSTETGFTWRLHRHRLQTMEWLRTWRKGFANADHPRIAAAQPAPG